MGQVLHGSATSIKAMIELLGRQITDFDRRIARLIDEDVTQASQARLLAAVPGIGPTVLATLLGDLSKLGTLCRRRITSLASLAPLPERGTWHGARCIWGSRRKVREALYIATLSASHYVPALVALRDRMRQKGKARKTILIAVARRILVILNAVLKTGTQVALA